MKIEPRNWEARTEQNVLPAANSKYEPLHISDEVVEEMASLLYTQQAIADRFKISRNYLMDKHGEAFHRGQKSLMGLMKSERARAIHDLHAWRNTVDPMTDRPNSWTDKDAPLDKLERLLDKAEARHEAMNKDTEAASAMISTLTDEELDSAILEVAARKGWTPPKEEA